MVKDIANRIQSRLDALGKNPSGVALEAGLGRSSVRDILLGRVGNPRIDTLRKLVGPLECTLDFLTGESDTPESTGTYRNLWYLDGQLQNPKLLEAGVFRAIKRPEFKAPRETPSDDTFLHLNFRDPRVSRLETVLFQVKDRSMVGANILEGDGLTAVADPFGEQQIPLTDGAIVIIKQTLVGLELEEMTARQVEVTKEGIWLRCRSDQQIDDIFLSGRMIEDDAEFLPNSYYTNGAKTRVSVLGVVVRVIRELPIADALYDFTHIND